MGLSKPLIAAAFMMTTCGPSWAATYYVAPKGTVISATADGTESKPLASVSSALKLAKGGDTILLKDGLHNPIKLYNVTFDAPVTIRSMNGRQARVEWILMNGTTRNFVFQNFSIWPSNLDAVERQVMINTGSGVTDVTFDNLDIRSGSDAATYPNWSAAEWGRHNLNAILTRGARTQIINNEISGISFGIQTFGDGAIIANNAISGFAGDGLRAMGNNTVVRNNLVTDCVQVSGNHADGFQSWQTTGPVTGLVVEGNTILEWSNGTVNPLRCKLQGIGLFDGFYDNLVIQNNVVSSSAYHGISVYGARNAKIVNNTVVSASGNPAKSPWMGIFPHKNGTPSTDVLVANNLAMSFRGTSSPTNRVVSATNTVLTYPAATLSSVTTFDYRPKLTSGFVDTGTASAAPKVDILSNPRPNGNGPDRGAYETGYATESTLQSTTTTSNPLIPTIPTTTSTAKFVSAP